MTSSKSSRGNAQAKPTPRAATSRRKNTAALKPATNRRRTAAQKPVTIATSKASTSTPKPTASKPKAPAGTSKLEQIISLLQRPDGASIAEICKATGWQTHSVRGAFAGTLKRKGHVITSDKVDDVRRYRIESQL